MADFDDELDALRRVDPLDPADLIPPEDPAAIALFERITMSETTTTPATPIEPNHSPPSRRRLLSLAGAAAAIAVAVGAVIFANGEDPEPEVAQPSETTLAPITPGGSSSASCVEIYDLQAVTNRETAFDGTVVRIEGDLITFTVNEWFRGGDGPEATLAGASTLAGLSSAGASLPIEAGVRLLVAGDGGFAWSCGFTQGYDPVVAAQWAQAFAG